MLPLKTQQGEEIDHVDLQQSRIAKDKQDIKAMVDLLESNRTNPFSSYQPLSSISVGATVSPEIERDLSRACLVGETAYQQFKKGRFKSEKPPVNVHHTLTKQKLKTFSDFNKTKDVKKNKGNKRVIRADLNLFARMIIIAESRQLQMQEVLLGVLENVRQDERLALACAAKEYLRRISIIWSSPLSDCNRVQATNQYALSVLRYLMWTQHWTLSELRDVDRAARKIIVENGGKHTANLTSLLYLPREKGSRGMRSVEHENKITKIKSLLQLYQNSDQTVEAV